MVLLFSGSAPQKSEDYNYSFVPNKNFYYMTGIEREKVIFMATKINEKVEETLFIEKTDSLREAWTGKMLDVDDMLITENGSEVLSKDIIKTKKRLKTASSYNTRHTVFHYAVMNSSCFMIIMSFVNLFNISTAITSLSSITLLSLL